MGAAINIEFYGVEILGLQVFFFPVTEIFKGFDNLYRYIGRYYHCVLPIY